jgi:hypothetical protein
VNTTRRSITLDTGRRSIDLPVDESGRLRRVAQLDRSAVTRADDSDAAIGFKGHAAVFNTKTWIGSKRWGFWEEIAPGAFAKTLGESDTRMLHNHNPDLILARASAGTLRLTEDDTGLAVDADMAPTSYGRDLAMSLDRGDVTQMSFAFTPMTYEWTVNADETETLRHTEIGELWDVSTVTYPAYVETDAGLRADLLAVCRSAGFESLELDELGRRLADPDPDLIAALRHLARGVTLAPAETTRVPEHQPVESTGATRKLRQAHLAAITRNHERRI